MQNIGTLCDLIDKCVSGLRVQHTEDMKYPLDPSISRRLHPRSNYIEECANTDGREHKYTQT